MTCFRIATGLVIVHSHARAAQVPSIRAPQQCKHPNPTIHRSFGYSYTLSSPKKIRPRPLQPAHDVIKRNAINKLWPKRPKVLTNLASQRGGMPGWYLSSGLLYNDSCWPRRRASSWICRCLSSAAAAASWMRLCLERSRSKSRRCCSCSNSNCRCVYACWLCISLCAGKPPCERGVAVLRSGTAWGGAYLCWLTGELNRIFSS